MQRHTSLLVLVAILTLPVSVLGQWSGSGLVQGRAGVVTDTTDDASVVHAERIMWQFSRSTGAKLQANFQLGAVLQQSTGLDQTNLFPEYELNGSYRLNPRLELGLVSYAQLRNPLGIAYDTLSEREMVHGIRLAGRSSTTNGYALTLGTRSRDIEEQQYNQQFVKLQLDRQLAGMRVRLAGEHNLYGSDDLDLDNRGRYHLQWQGSPIRNLNWTAYNSYQTHGDRAYWRIYQRANYALNDRTRLWAHVSQGAQDFRGTSLLQRQYDLVLRRQFGQRLALELLSDGERVTPAEDEPLAHHWRAYMAGAIWRLGSQAQYRGALHAGYRQSYRFGHGIDTRLELDEQLSLVENRKLRITLKDLLRTEFFFRLDETADPLLDLDHQLQLMARYRLARGIDLNNRVRLLNHVGSDLEFSSDTLRNALTHDLGLQRHGRRNRWSLNHYSIVGFGEDADLRLHLNARINRNLGPAMNVQLQSMWRYSSENYPTYLWLNAALKYRTAIFDWALECMAAGPPEDAFSQDLQIWMRFMRQI